MLSSKTAHQIAQGLLGVTEKDHFGGDGFYVNNRIFATLWAEKKEVNVRLNPAQQKAFVATDARAFYEIPNGFGRQGWTTIRLGAVGKKLFQQALHTAWENGALKAPARARARRSKRA